MLIVVLWYALALTVETFDVSNVPAYYALYATLSALTIWLCSKSNNILHKGYGVLNCIALVCYFFLIIDDYVRIHAFMWDGVYSFSQIVLLYEVLILIKGGRDVYTIRRRGGCFPGRRDILHIRHIEEA